MQSVSSCFGLLLEYIYQFLSFNERIWVNGKEYKVTRQLGEGGFGFVFLVKEKDAYGDPKALKRIRTQLPEHEMRALNEIAAHNAVNSPNVIKLLESQVLKSQNGFISEVRLLLPFYSNGTIQDMIDRLLPNEFIPFKQILKLSMGIIKGLDAFHSQEPTLAFRDLKPANVLIGNDGDAILMDLGSVTTARVKIESRKEAMALYDFCAETVTAPYRPPELHDPPSFGYVDESTDIW